MDTSKILERILELPYARIRVIYWACKGYGRKKISEFCKLTVSGVDFQKDKAIEEFEDIIPELFSEKSDESKRNILIKALENDVLELFEPYKINAPEELLPTTWEMIRNRKKYGSGGEAQEETGEEKPEIIDPPPPPFWELLLHQINKLWNRIPEGLPRILIPGIGIGLVFVLLIWALADCGGPPTPTPTSEPPGEVADGDPEEPTEDPQVDPPADTEVPPPTAIPTETFTPTITLTPTLTPTPTITHTPTITPTWVGPGDDNLPLTFEGTYKVPSYYPFDMKLYIEEKSGDNVSGKFQWPDRNNRFQGWEGIIVHDFGDVIEESKWEQVEGFGSEGTYIKETRKWVISAGGGIDGNYYFYISPEGRLTGLWFRRDDLTPEATVDLDFSE